MRFEKRLKIPPNSDPLFELLFESELLLFAALLLVDVPPLLDPPLSAPNIDDTASPKPPRPELVFVLALLSLLLEPLLKMELTTGLAIAAIRPPKGTELKNILIAPCTSVPKIEERSLVLRLPLIRSKPTFTNWPKSKP